MARTQEAGEGRCRGCGRSLGDSLPAGWECECGVMVCNEPECFEDWFKLVAAGEGTRCLTCGLLT